MCNLTVLFPGLSFVHLLSKCLLSILPSMVYPLSIVVVPATGIAAATEVVSATDVAAAAEVVPATDVAAATVSIRGSRGADL